VVEGAIRAGQLLELAAQLDGGNPAARLIGRALRRNADLLTTHPELVLPTIYPLAWFGSPEEPLRDCMRAWIDAWSAMERGPWLRALCPHVLPVGSPLVAEHSGPSGFNVPWFSSDGSIVGVTGEAESMAWSRVTGERLSADAAASLAPPPPATPRYSRGTDSGTLWELAIDDTHGGGFTLEVPDAGIGVFDELPGGDVLAGGWAGDDDGIVLRIDRVYRRVVWQTRLGTTVTGLRVSRDGTRIVANTCYSGQSMLDAETGNRLAWYPSDGAVGVLAPDGHDLASWSGTTLQIWIPKRDDDRWRSPDGLHSVIAAQYSPDGALLVRGNTLYEATSAKPIERLEIASTDCIEGGPQPGCTRVLDDGVVQLNTLHGMTRWNAAGEPVIRNEDGWRPGVCRLAISPDGRHYGVSGDYYGLAAICAVDDGTVLRQLERPPPEAMAWSPMGRLLANASEGALYLTPLAGDERHLGDFTTVMHLSFSMDGRLVAGHADGVDHLWRIDGTRIAQRDAAPLYDDDAWRASVHGWEQFRLWNHDLRGTQSGVLWVIRDFGGEAVAAVPCTEPLIPSPDGSTWAGRLHHFALTPPVVR
jgi:hypothetical protein